ncbi:hemolysin family protein [Actinopolymorpha sp. B11F2]|uniref:hemolysin family protein n=1 Tax=Actinopolymorpha sp. B11F2 TaxID=3160862 RepID=UPI0032E405F8
MVVLSVLLGVLVVGALTVLTGYFVAQEFSYMTVDRSRLKAAVAAGDAGAKRALGITGRTSFMLSGAQLGITVTGLLVGYVAEPLIGAGLGKALGGVGIPQPVGVAVGTVLALVFSTAVQMVFGELFPKNLAIARPELLARALARSTTWYLAGFGWLIWLFDQAANLLLRLVRIEPVHDVEHAATPRDLEHIIAESRTAGELPADLSGLLDRVLGFHDSTAEHAMIPRPYVTAIAGTEPVRRVLEVMAAGHSRLPVVGESIDEVIGVLSLHDVLAADESQDLGTVPVRDLARPAVLVPSTSPLPNVLARLNEAGEQLACVMDEYGGLAGVITIEDVAEELVGEIVDEHDPVGEDQVHADNNGDLTVPGTLHIDEAERVLGHNLPAGDYQTISGLIITQLHRLPEPGDAITLQLAASPDGDHPAPRLTLIVLTVDRHVPQTVQLHLADTTRNPRLGQHGGTVAEVST